MLRKKCEKRLDPGQTAPENGSSGRREDNSRVSPVPNLDNAIAIRDAVARPISDVYAGKLQTRIAAGLAPLIHLQLRALEKTEFEKRPGARVERLLRDSLSGD